MSFETPFMDLSQFLGWNGSVPVATRTQRGVGFATSRPATPANSSCSAGSGRLAAWPRRVCSPDVTDPHGARAVIGIQGIESAHQPGLAGTVPRVEQVGLDLCDR